MKKQDAPRLKRFLGSLMRAEFVSMKGKDMVQLVGDMTWLSDFAEELEKPPRIEIKSIEPMDKPAKQRIKSKKTK